jgi:short subunit dehydrogenase-like uncharacterized protein
MTPVRDTFLLYGSYGYTGDLIARQAVQQGLYPVLAGRNRQLLEKQAAELGLPCMAFSLEDPDEIDQGLSGFPAVLHCAGPYSHTFDAMASACLRTGVHYLDITGEIPVFEALAARGRQAFEAGVMLLPGVGFDVVATDCLAAHLKNRLPGAASLALAFHPVGSRFSRGTATSAIERSPKGGLIRQEGKLTPVPFGTKIHQVDFGRGAVPAVAIPWGDVSTAYYSTGIPNIEVFIALPGFVRRLLPLVRYLGGVLALPAVQKGLKSLLHLLPAGPSARQRTHGFTLLWGEAREPGGERVAVRARTPESYAFTATAALSAVGKVLEGMVKPGFQTPSLAFGADFLLAIEGTSRFDFPVKNDGV